MRMKIRNFISPRKVIIGFGASKETGAEVALLGAKRVLLATDKFLHENGPVNEIRQSIEQKGIEVVVYDGTVPDPTVGNVEDAYQLFQSADCDAVVSVGGGSPTDVGKAVALLATNGGGIRDYQGFDRAKKKPLPQIAVNTTAGTGAECSQSAVISDIERNLKMLVKSELIVPPVAIEDPELTVSMPPKVTADTGLDALTHAIESYVSTEAFDVTEVLSLTAIERISRNLRRAWSDAQDREARHNMMVASMQAGLAFGNARVALVHAMAGPLAARFHLTHGHSNAVLLPRVMEFNAESCQEKSAQIARAMGADVSSLPPSQGALEAATAARQLLTDLGVRGMRESGIAKTDFEKCLDKMAEDALAGGSPKFNPRKATKEEIVDIYLKAYGSP